MRDSRIDALIATLDVAASPDPGFRDDLFADLAPRVRRARQQDATWIGRLRQVLASPVAPPVARRAMPVLALLGLLLVALVGLLVLGSRRTAPPDPFDAVGLVDRSRALFEAPPPFDMTVAFDGGAVRRYRFDGTSLRIDVEAGEYPPLGRGGWLVQTGDRRVEWFARAGIGRILESDSGRGWSLWPLELSWALENLRSGYSAWQRSMFPTCMEWAVHESASVAGRSAHRIGCAAGVERREFWLDDETGFIVGIREGELSGRATALELGIEQDPDLDPEVFAVPAGPQWARPVERGALEPGLVATCCPEATILARLPAPGWQSDGVRLFSKPAAGPGWLLLDRLVAPVDPSTARAVSAPADARGYADWLAKHPYVVAERAVEATVDGVAAVKVDFRIRLPAGSRPAEPCRNDPEARCIPLLQIGEGDLRGQVDAIVAVAEGEPIERWRVWFIDLGPRGVGIILWSVPDGRLETLEAEVEQIVGSVVYPR